MYEAGDLVRIIGNRYRFRRYHELPLGEIGIVLRPDKNFGGDNYQVALIQGNAPVQILYPDDLQAVDYEEYQKMKLVS